MGCAASAMSRLRRGALTAASSASAGVADGSNGKLAMQRSISCCIARSLLVGRRVLEGGGGCGPRVAVVVQQHYTKHVSDKSYHWAQRRYSWSEKGFRLARVGLPTQSPTDRGHGCLTTSDKR